MNILEWARNKECKVIYAGSSSVHSGHYSNPYTFSKVMVDELCIAYKKIFGVNAKICRFYNVYGPHQLTEGEYCTVIGIFERQYANKEPLTITSDGEQRRDFTHIDDIVDGLILTSESDDLDLDIIELGRGHNHSINELADMFGKDYPTEYIAERPGEARITLCDTSVAKKDIKYNPRVNLKDYIEEVVSE
jgi:UDP-glucose 4-epimerase